MIDGVGQAMATVYRVVKHIPPGTMERETVYGPHKKLKRVTSKFWKTQVESVIRLTIPPLTKRSRTTYDSTRLKMFNIIDVVKTQNALNEFLNLAANQLSGIDEE